MGAFTNIEKSHTQTARPGTTSCRPYKYLFRVGIEPATRSSAVERPTTASTVPSTISNIPYFIIIIRSKLIIFEYKSRFVIQTAVGTAALRSILPKFHLTLSSTPLWKII